MSHAELLQAFDLYRIQLEKTTVLRESIREVVTKIEGCTRVMHAALLPIHSGSAHLAAQAVGQAKTSIPELQEHFAELANLLKGHPGQYHRFHDHWRGQSSMASFLLVFIHWLESGTLLSHLQVERALGLSAAPASSTTKRPRFAMPDSEKQGEGAAGGESGGGLGNTVSREEFTLELEDYLTGLCTFSNELPRYVVNRVTAGDYECPRQVSAFLSALHAGFRLLNLRNDFLRKRVDGLKYDSKKVEEVLYDVTIRGLLKEGKPSKGADALACV